MRNSHAAKLFLAGVLVVFGVALAPFQSAWAEKLVIQVYSVKVRSEPSLIAPSLGELKNKQEITKLAEQGAFMKVRSGQLEGWIPRSAVIAAKKLKLKEANEVNLSRPEVMAAGKGIGDSSSGSGKKGAPSAADLKRVDEVESTTKTSDADVAKFKASSGLRPGLRAGGSK